MRFDTVTAMAVMVTIANAIPLQAQDEASLELHKRNGYDTNNVSGLSLFKRAYKNIFGKSTGPDKILQPQAPKKIVHKQAGLLSTESSSSSTSFYSSYTSLTSISESSASSTAEPSLSTDASASTTQSASSTSDISSRASDDDDDETPITPVGHPLIITAPRPSSSSTAAVEFTTIVDSVPTPEPTRAKEGRRAPVPALIAPPEKHWPEFGLYGRMDLLRALHDAPTELAKMEILASHGGNSSFVFDFNNPPSSAIYPGEGGTVISTFDDNFPATYGTGLGMSVFQLEPCALVPPHIRPRANEQLVVIDGHLKTQALYESAAEYISNDLSSHQATVFPQGALRFVYNPSCDHASYVSAYNSADPGITVIAPAFFSMDDQAVIGAMGNSPISGGHIDSLREYLPEGVVTTVQSCLQRCSKSQYKQKRSLREAYEMDKGADFVKRQLDDATERATFHAERQAKNNAGADNGTPVEINAKKAGDNGANLDDYERYLDRQLWGEGLWDQQRERMKDRNRVSKYRQSVQRGDNGANSGPNANDYRRNRLHQEEDGDDDLGERINSKNEGLRQLERSEQDLYDRGDGRPANRERPRKGVLRTFWDDIFGSGDDDNYDYSSGGLSGLLSNSSDPLVDRHDMGDRSSYRDYDDNDLRNSTHRQKAPKSISNKQLDYDSSAEDSGSESGYESMDGDDNEDYQFPSPYGARQYHASPYPYEEEIMYEYPLPYRRQARYAPQHLPPSPQSAPMARTPHSRLGSKMRSSSQYNRPPEPVSKHGFLDEFFDFGDEGMFFDEWDDCDDDYGWGHGHGWNGWDDCCGDCDCCEQCCNDYGWGWNHPHHGNHWGDGWSGWQRDNRRGPHSEYSAPERFESMQSMGRESSPGNMAKLTSGGPRIEQAIANSSNSIAPHTHTHRQRENSMDQRRRMRQLAQERAFRYAEQAHGKYPKPQRHSSSLGSHRGPLNSTHRSLMNDTSRKLGYGGEDLMDEMPSHRYRYRHRQYRHPERKNGRFKTGKKLHNSTYDPRLNSTYEPPMIGSKHMGGKLRESDPYYSVDNSDKQTAYGPHIHQGSKKQSQTQHHGSAVQDYDRPYMSHDRNKIRGRIRGPYGPSSHERRSIDTAEAYNEHFEDGKPEDPRFAENLSLMDPNSTLRTNGTTSFWYQNRPMSGHYGAGVGTPPRRQKGYRRLPANQGRPRIHQNKQQNKQSPPPPPLPPPLPPHVASNGHNRKLSNTKHPTGQQRPHKAGQPHKPALKQGTKRIENKQSWYPNPYYYQSQPQYYQSQYGYPQYSQPQYGYSQQQSGWYGYGHPPHSGKLMNKGHVSKKKKHSEKDNGGKWKWKWTYESDELSNTTNCDENPHPGQAYEYQVPQEYYEDDHGFYSDFDQEPDDYGYYVPAHYVPAREPVGKPVGVPAGGPANGTSQRFWFGNDSLPFPFPFFGSSDEEEDDEGCHDDYDDYDDYEETGCGDEEEDFCEDDCDEDDYYYDSFGNVMPVRAASHFGTPAAPIPRRERKASYKQEDLDHMRSRQFKGYQDQLDHYQAAHAPYTTNRRNRVGPLPQVPQFDWDRNRLTNNQRYASPEFGPGNDTLNDRPDAQVPPPYGHFEPHGRYRDPSIQGNINLSSEHVESNEYQKQPSNDGTSGPHGRHEHKSPEDEFLLNFEAVGDSSEDPEVQTEMLPVKPARFADQLKHEDAPDSLVGRRRGPLPRPKEEFRQAGYKNNGADEGHLTKRNRNAVDILI